MLALQLQLGDPQEPLCPHADHAVAAQPVDLLARLLVDGQRTLERSELVLVGHGVSFPAARAMAPILSAKFTWLSSGGSQPILVPAVPLDQERGGVPRQPEAVSDRPPLAFPVAAR